MSTSRKGKGHLPDFTNKMVAVSVAGLEEGRSLEHPQWEIQGGRLFLVSTVPRGASSNHWCSGIRSAVAWDQVIDYQFFDSAKQYLERLAVYEGKKKKR